MKKLIITMLLALSASSITPMTHADTQTTAWQDGKMTTTSNINIQRVPLSIYVFKNGKLKAINVKNFNRKPKITMIQTFSGRKYAYVPSVKGWVNYNALQKVNTTKISQYIS